MPVAVSIVMLSYNHKNYIEEAIRSILHQTFSDWELIIIDDASTDGSQQIIEKFLDNDSRINAVFHNQNKGIPASTVEGINAAKGKFIAFLDSDDVWLDEKLSIQIAVLEKDENFVVWSEGEIIDEHGEICEKKFTDIYGHAEKEKSGYILESLLRHNYIFQSSFIIKTENIRNIQINQELKYLNDYKYVVDLACKYKYYFIEKPLAKYRIHGQSTYQRDIDDYRLDDIKLRIFFIKMFNNKVSDDLIYHQENVIISEVDALLSEKDGRIAALTEQLNQSENRALWLENEISDMRRSVVWTLTMKYHDTFVERLLPPNTRKRNCYDRGIKGLRIIMNEGWGLFWCKFNEYRASRKG